MLDFIQNADWSILHWIRENLRCGALDFLLPKLTLLGEGGAVWIAVGLALLLSKKYRRYGICLLGALVAGLLICNIGAAPPLLVGEYRPAGKKSQGLLLPLGSHLVCGDGGVGGYRCQPQVRLGRHSSGGGAGLLPPVPLCPLPVGHSDGRAHRSGAGHSGRRAAKAPARQALQMLNTAKKREHLPVKMLLFFSPADAFIAPPAPPEIAVRRGQWCSFPCRSAAR